MTRLTLKPTRWLALLARRGLQALVLALLVGTLCFFMARVLPGDLAMRIAAGRYGYDLVSHAAAQAVRAELGLDLPLLQALARWWGDLARGQLGLSLVTGVPVWQEVRHQLGHTVYLALAAAALAAGVGLPLGIAAGLRPGGWADRLTVVLAVVLRGMPPFLLALVLMLLMAVQLGVLPVAGDVHDGGVVLPALTLALPLTAGLARVTRHASREATLLPSHEFSRTKGLSDLQVLLRHDLRHLALPVLAYLGVQTVFLAEGALVVETLFAWPGIGHALVHAIFGRDVPMIQGTALCMGLLFVLFNLAVDAVCLAIDPRQKATGAGHER